ncbi:MAG: aminotransferase class V-fold PLP-dependent enzyme [Thermoanaerobaculia bacterium]
MAQRSRASSRNSAPRSRRPRASSASPGHSSSGVKLPLREIASAVREVNASRDAAKRVVLVVDGVHGLGAESPDVVATGVDVFVSGLHKWMLAPRGTGFVWARPSSPHATPGRHLSRRCRA